MIFANWIRNHILRWSEMRFKSDFYKYETQQGRQIQSDSSASERLSIIPAATTRAIKDNTTTTRGQTLK